MARSENSIGMSLNRALESRRTLAMYLAAFASCSALAARGLTVPLYARDLGADRFQVGALFSVATLAASIASMPAGVIVDRVGSRKVIVIAMVVATISQLGTSTTVTVLPLIAWQVTSGLAFGAQQAAIFSEVAASVPSGRLGRAMGWLTFSMQAGFFVGPSIAGLALEWLDIRTDIAVTAVLLLLAIPAVFLVGDAPQVLQMRSLRGPLQALVRQPLFAQVALGVAAMTLVWGTVGAFLPIFSKEALGLSGSEVGLLVALMAVANGAGRLVAGRLVDRARERWLVIFVGTIVWSAATIVLGHLSSFWTVALLLVLATPFMATVFVAIGVAFADLASGTTRGVAMGAFGTISFLGLTAGPLLFGPVIQHYGYSAGFTISASVGLSLALVSAALRVRPHRQRADISPAQHPSVLK